jgi:hypothetical protein
MKSKSKNLPKGYNAHNFGPKDTCTICGCSKGAVRHFKWACNRPLTREELEVKVKELEQQRAQLYNIVRNVSELQYQLTTLNNIALVIKQQVEKAKELCQN